MEDNETYEDKVVKAEYTYEALKDRVHDQQSEIESLKTTKKHFFDENRLLERHNLQLINIINLIEQRLIDNGVDDEILNCCDMYDVNGVELRKYIKKLKEDNNL